MSDLMQNQSPQEQTARIMIQGDIKYETIASETAKNTAQVKTADITPSKIIEQISKQLEGMYNTSKLNMVLNPGSLGKVNLQLMNSKDGLIAQFTVTTKEAHELLLKGIDGLKENLLAQGVNFDNVSVKLDEFESEYKFDWTEQEGSRGGNKQQNSKKQQEKDIEFDELFESKKDDVEKQA
jgi:flagellar hook-length control protein FliK